MKQIKFIKSLRFWAMVILAIAQYGKIKGFVGEAEIALINTIFGGFIAVRTVDRTAEQFGNKK